MKAYYKLLKDLPTYHAGDLFVLDPTDHCLYFINSENGQSNHWRDRVMAYRSTTLEHFPDILGGSEWFERVANPEGESELEFTPFGEALYNGMAFGQALKDGMKITSLAIDDGYIDCMFSLADCSERIKTMIKRVFMDIIHMPNGGDDD